MPASGHTAPPDETILHASAVAVAGKACLILGASGTGKSALALRLMALGAMLVADDRVVLRRTGDTVTAHAPDPIRGLIEARGIGLLRAECADAVPLGLVVDLDRTETDRLPPPRSHVLLGLSFPCLHNSAYPAYAEAIGQYMTFGRYA